MTRVKTSQVEKKSKEKNLVIEKQIWQIFIEKENLQICQLEARQISWRSFTIW